MQTKSEDASPSNVDVAFLVPFAAGNFVYLGASDLVPEVRGHEHLGANLLHFAAFCAGLAPLWVIG